MTASAIPVSAAQTRSRRSRVIPHRFSLRVAARIHGRGCPDAGVSAEGGGVVGPGSADMGWSGGCGGVALPECRYTNPLPLRGRNARWALSRPQSDPMIEALKSDAIVEKLGGRFKLTALIQRRLGEIIDGARPLVDRNGRSDLEVVIDEIMQEKITLEMDPEHIEKMRGPGGKKR